MHHRAVNIAGMRVGYLTAIKYRGSDGKNSLWIVKCDCGTEKLMDPSEFKKLAKRGVIASCGCKRKATISARISTHGMSRHPAFAVWRSMVDRCTLPTHHAWGNYGGRGITVCDSWRESFAAFWADMGPTYAHGLSLDRADNDKGYSPENCRWVTSKEQARNTRRSLRVATPYGVMSPAELAERTGIGLSTLYYRLARGVAPEELIAPPDTTRRFSTSSTAARATGS